MERIFQLVRTYIFHFFSSLKGMSAENYFKELITLEIYNTDMKKLVSCTHRISDVDIDKSEMFKKRITLGSEVAIFEFKASIQKRKEKTPKTLSYCGISQYFSNFDYLAYIDELVLCIIGNLSFIDYSS